MPPDRAATGRQGEDAAARYLVRQGCSVLARNWHANPGEIDIVAQCPVTVPGSSPSERELVFVEIRTRHGRAGLAEESITRRKATRMASAAFSYMAAHDIDPGSTPWRIDLIAISMSDSSITGINWIRGAIDESMVDMA